MDYTIEPLDHSHLKSGFINRHDSLQLYLRNFASQDIKRKVSQCFVLTQGNKVVKGYYTLSNTSILFDQIPNDFIKKNKLPNYKNLPATLIGRLAVDANEERRGFGERLLMDSLCRSYETSKTIASFAVIVDFLDESAKKFYLKYGFLELVDANRLFIPMKLIEKMVD